MADKSTQLSITIRTVDAATAKIKAINAEIDRVNKPVRDLKSAMGDLFKKSGLDDLVGGFKNVGSAVGDLLGKVAMVGGVAGLAVGGLLHLVDGFDDLGKKAQRLGVGVDFLAGMRDAAEHAGVPIEALDSSLDAFAVNIGKARAGAGRMAAFLPKVGTNLHSDFGATLLAQMKAAKGNAAALDVLADAMARLKDPAERAALAQMTVGDKDLAPLLAQGSKGIKELRDHYIGFAGSQEDAVVAATGTHDAMLKLKASTDQVKASLVSGLSPALTTIIDQINTWLSGHQEDIKQWAADIGKRLPDAFNTLVDGIKSGMKWIGDLVDDIGGWKNAAIAVAAVMAGPLIAAVVALGTALATNPMFLELTATVTAVYELAKAFGFLDSKVNKISDVGVITSAGGVLSAGFKGGIAGLANLTMPKVGGGDLHMMGPMGLQGLLGSDDQKFFERPSLRPQIDELARSGAGWNGPWAAGKVVGDGATKANILVKFENAPRGMRAVVDPQSTADVDLNTGYQLAFP